MRKGIKGLIWGLSLFCLAFTSVKAQQAPLYSHYVFNTLAYNPAYAGSRNVASASALYRNQWVGFDGAPKTAIFSADAPFGDERMGLGIQLINDEIGVTKTTGAALSAAYKIVFSNDANLSFGMQGSFSNFSASFTSLNLKPGGGGLDPVYQQDINRNLYNFGSGIYFSTARLYIGFSVLDILSNPLGLNTNGARQVTHSYFAAGYVFPLNDNFDLKTAALVKGVKGAPIQTDVNLTLWIMNMLAVGVEYRTNADVAASMELNVTPSVALGYAYDRSTTSLRNYNTGSHELMIRYIFSFGQRNALSPRYF